MEFQLTWVVGRFAGNLAEYRQAFHDAAGDYNEAIGLPRGALLAPVSFDSVPSHRRAAADSNLRMCHYFVLTVEDSWDAPPASFRHDYKLALACKADPNLPLREIVVLFRRLSEAEAAAGDADERLAAFRKALHPGVRQFDFTDVAEFRAQVTGLFPAWMERSA